MEPEVGTGRDSIRPEDVIPSGLEVDWKRPTFIAGLRCDGLTAPWIIDRPMAKELFET